MREPSARGPCGAVMDFLKKIEAQLDTAVGGPTARPEASLEPEAPPGSDGSAARADDDAATAQRLASALARCKQLEARLGAKTDLCADKDAQIAAVRHAHATHRTALHHASARGVPRGRFVI